MEKFISIFHSEFPERLLLFVGFFICEAILDIVDEVQVIFTGLWHKELLDVIELEGSIIPIENLFGHITMNVLGEVCLPPPDVVVVVCEHDWVLLDSFSIICLGLWCTLFVSLIEVS